jgi:hypothetical protein
MYTFFSLLKHAYRHSPFSAPVTGNPGIRLYRMFAHDIQYSKPLTKECDIMPDHYYNHSRRNQRSLTEPYNTSAYPGLGSYEPSSLPGESGIVPTLGAEAAETALALPAAEATTKAGGLAGLLGGLGGGGGAGNIEQIKGIIDRMGGVDGIMNSMGKVQKVMSGFQQMAPMVKLVMGSFGKNKGSGALAAEEDAALYSPNRRKKRRSTSQRRKSSTTNRRRSTSSTGKRRRK